MKEPDADLDKIIEYAEAIYAIATNFSKQARHNISDAANLVHWFAYDNAHPEDPDSKKAISDILAALSARAARNGESVNETQR